MNGVTCCKTEVQCTLKLIFSTFQHIWLINKKEVKTSQMFRDRSCLFFLFVCFRTFSADLVLPESDFEKRVKQIAKFIWSVCFGQVESCLFYECSKPRYLPLTSSCSLYESFKVLVIFDITDFFYVKVQGHGCDKPLR